MIPRYTRPEMGSIWTDQNKFQKWLEVEIATAEVEAEAGLIPKSAALAIRRKARFEVERILEIEAKVKHDVIAFTTNVAEHVGRGGPLPALRAHLERRRGHRASSASSPGFGSCCWPGKNGWAKS